MREGSANEDIALMEALGEIVSTVDRLQDEVASLLGVLVQFGFMSEGKNIQRTFEKLLGLVKSKMDEIWPPQGKEQPLSNLSDTNIGVNSTYDVVVVLNMQIIVYYMYIYMYMYIMCIGHTCWTRYHCE